MAATSTSTSEQVSRQAPPTDWIAVARELAPGFASRAPAYDANDSFVAENYRELKEHRVFSAGVPTELGGGGATHPELCALLQEIAHACGSTALALAMHTHLVATTVWAWRQGRPVGPRLEQIAARQLVLVTTAASDWLDSGGTAERVDGGYRITGRKTFASGSPAGDLLLTTTAYDDPIEGPSVLHVAIPFKSPGVTILDNWRTMGMRGTGSNDIVLDGVFLPDDAVEARRPRGQWFPVLNAVAVIALPLIMSVYLGVAEAARELVLQQLAKKRDDADVWYQVGEMENALVTGRMAVRELIDLCADYSFAPEIPTANAAFIRKTIATDAFRRAIEKGLEAVGGGGFFRSRELEHLLRDIHAAQFHPLQEKRQLRFSGRLALGLDPVA
jgi:alkylation response protein AidB-like acyl-CoA dehydrogenase